MQLVKPYEANTDNLDLAAPSSQRKSKPKKLILSWCGRCRLALIEKVQDLR